MIRIFFKVGRVSQMVRSRPFLKTAQTSFSFCGAVSQRKKLRKSTKNDTSFLTGHIRAHYQLIEAFLAVAIFRKVDQNFSSCISRLVSSLFWYFEVRNQILVISLSRKGVLETFYKMEFLGNFEKAFRWSSFKFYWRSLESFLRFRKSFLNISQRHT